MSYLIPIVVHIRLPTLDLYVGSGDGSSPLMILRSVLPGVRIGFADGMLKVSWSLEVNVFIDSVIVPLSLCSISKPMKCFGLENLTLKCCVN